jgi:hypothetical protein
MESGLFGTARELVVMIPVPISILGTGFVFGYFIHIQRKKVDSPLLKIRKHITLLFLAWVAAAMLAGFFVSSGILEMDETISVVEGLSYGLRWSLILIPCGFVILCLPPIIWMASFGQQR